MMMNIRGGIANVTLGETQIQGEMWAKEFLGIKEEKIMYENDL